jgi:hypothetical protein
MAHTGSYASTARLGVGEPVVGRGHLPHQHRLGEVPLPLGERLPHAHDGREPVASRRAELGRHLRVGLAHQLPALGVAHDHPAAADGLQHLARHLAGERAVRFGV